MDNDIQAGTVLAVPPKCAVRSVATTTAAASTAAATAAETATSATSATIRLAAGVVDDNETEDQHRDGCHDSPDDNCYEIFIRITGRDHAGVVHCWYKYA